MASPDRSDAAASDAAATETTIGVAIPVPFAVTDAGSATSGPLAAPADAGPASILSAADLAAKLLNLSTIPSGDGSPLSLATRFRDPALSPSVLLASTMSFSLLLSPDIANLPPLPLPPSLSGVVDRLAAIPAAVKWAVGVADTAVPGVSPPTAGAGGTGAIGPSPTPGPGRTRPGPREAPRAGASASAPANGAAASARLLSFPRPTPVLAGAVTGLAARPLG
ncbi:MAG: hypothetical protein WAL63_21470, partial [Solirubrobacteraceae bacterium]